MEQLGVVGITARKVLEEKNLPISEYVFFSSSKSAGKKIVFLGKEYTVREKAAQIAVKYEYTEIIDTLKEDNNYYVRAIFLNH